MTATHLRISPGTRRFCSCPSRVEASGPCWSASCWPTRTRSRGTPAAECPRSSCLRRRRRRRRRGIKLGEERAGGCVSALEREAGVMRKPGENARTGRGKRREHSGDATTPIAATPRGRGGRRHMMMLLIAGRTGRHAMQDVASHAHVSPFLSRLP